MIQHTWTRLVAMIGLVFYISATGCDNNADSGIRISWDSSRPTGILVPTKMLALSGSDNMGDHLKIRLTKSKDSTAILGEYVIADDDIHFKPLLPLTRGLEYHVYYNDILLQSVKVPPADPGGAPEVVRIYPSADTLPENQLKLYIQFSQPMREGNFLEHIVLIRNGTDTIQNAFLDVDMELWNQQHDVLTVWFDPGRIKRGLQPNIAMGNPLQAHQQYELHVLSSWQDVEGRSLKANGTKKIITGLRDSISPDIDKWKLITPRANTNAPLRIHFGESLDAILLTSTITLRKQSDTISYELIPVQQETGIEITPHANWRPGMYIIEVDARLEDLAGNNLNHLFDQPLNKKPRTQKTYRRAFSIARR
jgi:hypothetical protein